MAIKADAPIALGGGVLTAFTVGMFEAIGLDVERLADAWLLPCGALGAVIVGSWLVEARQSVIENMAPVLTRLFTPMFAIVLLAFLGTMAWTGRGIDIVILLVNLACSALLYVCFLRGRGLSPPWNAGRRHICRCTVFGRRSW